MRRLCNCNYCIASVEIPLGSDVEGSRHRCISGNEACIFLLLQGPFFDRIEDSVAFFRA